MSDRNDEEVILVSQELNVLTVEDYCKWYGLYYLMEDPDTKEIMLVTLTFGDIIKGVDHYYYPDSVIEFCKINNIKIDSCSYLCICKMMLEEVEFNTNIQELLPPMRDLCETVEYDEYAISRTFYVCIYDNPLTYSYDGR